MEVFRFKRFEVVNEASPMKVNSDGVLLGAAVPLGKETRRVLDVGTGTGTVALIVAQRLEELGCADFMIEGIDIDPAAASEASFNFSRSPWKENLGSTCVSLSGYVPGTPVDLIVSNPPYFDSSLPNPDGRDSMARHEGDLSCFTLIDFAAGNLAPAGTLTVIFPALRENEVTRYARGKGFRVRRLLRIRTTGTKPPSRVIATFGQGGPSETIQEELVLTQKGKRTQEYASLVNDFYL